MKTRTAPEIDKALFDVASEIADSSVRTDFLARACGEDTVLLSRIHGWIEARDAAEEFFRTAGVARTEMGEELLGELRAESAAILPPSGPPISDADGPGSLIGRYRILERIGEGGCGVVFLAEQSEPVRRNVALKVIRLGLDTESVIARFESERQSLAMMDHPGIAKVFDAGTTESGRPYFVMELVQGDRITTYCEKLHLGIKQRLELFIQVCHAIQHAHQKGVIHRDIKPSNILVTIQDGQSLPKVIDFGIARAVDSRFSEETRLTMDAQLIGTPAYMGPEQAAGSLNLDTRGDIYSLGVLLYELLTGRTPFDGKRLAQAGMLEMLRILREEEPPVPSVMLARLPVSDLMAVASERSIDPKSLISSIRGDLDGIILRALAKEPQNRYATVTGLAADIRRHLNNEPVAARPPGRFYLFSKWVRRNKIVFSATTAIALAIIAGGALSGWFYLRERDARKTAEAARANEARLLHQSKAREAVSMAAMLLAEGKIEDAENMLAGTPLDSIEPTMEAVLVFRSYGNWNAIHQRWAKAAECFELFIESGGFSRISPGDVMWSLMAVAISQVEAGKTEDYEKFRSWMTSSHGGSTNYIFNGVVIKCALLQPASQTTFDGLQPFADNVEQRLRSRSQDSIDAEHGAFAAMSMALLEYRRGNFSEAIDWCQISKDFPDSNDARNATVHAISAMAAAKLGQAARAHTDLAVAQAFVISSPMPDASSYQGPGQGYWLDCAIARILIREAAEIVK